MASVERLEADAATLHRLLDSEKEFLAPLFQRRFVWGDTELDRLWDDIDQVLDQEDNTRFLGAIVLQDHSSKLAFAPRRFWVIDGQQRLTTLYLVLTAIAELAEATSPGSLAGLVIKGYLLNQQGNNQNKPKIRPTNRDLNQFSEVLQRLKSIKAEPPAAFGEATGKLATMYTRVRRDIARRAKLQGVGYLDSLATTVLERLKFVQIVLSEDEDPHQVYDSLNNAGQKLEIVDSVRNEVFQKFGDDLKGAEALYNTRWRSFEDSLGGNLNAYFFPFTLIHKPSTTKSRVFADLKILWKDSNPNQVLDSLMSYVPAFKALTTGESLELSVDLREAIDRLRRMPAPAATYPFTMRVVHKALIGDIDQAIATHSLNLVESFLVRRAFAGFEPTGLHAVFKDLWNQTEAEPSKILSTVDDNPTIHFPNDDQFLNDIAVSDLYHRRLAKYILIEYERGLKGGDPMPQDVAVTMDHVMPQEPSAEWLQIVPSHIYSNLVDTWANLVPLSNPFNAQKGQKSWPEVRKLFKTETIFKTTKRLAEDFENWDQGSINERSAELQHWALQRWPKA